MNRNPFVIPSACLIVCLTSCMVKREVPFRPTPACPATPKVARYDYSTYSRIPDRPTSLAYRAFLKTIPYTRQRAFWGNWGGCGSNGGTPVDEMDEIFRRHDIIYYESRSLATMRAADKACVAALQRLNTATMSPEAGEYRQRALRFFSNPTYAPIGKPLGCFVYSTESPESPFQTDHDINRFFGIGDAPASNFAHRSGRLKPREAVGLNGNKPASLIELAMHRG